MLQHAFYPTHADLVAQSKRCRQNPVAQPRPTPQQAIDELSSRVDFYVPFPSKHATVQPSPRTLINFETCFATDHDSFEHDVVVFGYKIRYVARPVGYLWNFGDGQTMPTTTPGACPGGSVTHRYQRLGDVKVSVSTTYTARAAVQGIAGWTSIPGSVTIAGPATPLHVSEITPQLTDGKYGH